MNSHRRLTWLIFAVCALLLVDGLGWVTWQVLRLERSERFARQDAQLQEAVRLSLWRMDGMLSPIIAAETGRPYFQYRAFYPAARAYNQMWEPVGAGEVLVPSPLLSGPQEYIRLHFESTPEGWLTSPQAPDATLRDRLNAESLPLADMLTVERRLVELNSILRGTSFQEDPSAFLAAPSRERRADADEPALNAAERELRLLAKQSPPPVESDNVGGRRDPQAQESENDRSVVEYEARQQTVARAQGRNEANELSARDGQRLEADRPTVTGESAVLAPEAAASDEMRLSAALESSEGGGGGQDSGAVTQGSFTPVWRANPTTGEAELLFVRVVTVNGRELLQGFWVDWPRLRADLLASVADLLPEAELEPIGALIPSRLASGQLAGPAGGLASAGRLLASVPAVLAPGVTAQPALSGLTPTRIVLVVAWLAVVAAVVAIGLVLRASLALSERRGRFVSAVTHELRTPLTTFCLYSQMLADGMVQGEDRRREYLSTLKRESERLATIVENVLIYARTGNRVSAGEPRPVRSLLEAVVPLLEQRTGQAGMDLEVDVDLSGSLSVAGDAASLDRVLGNLVDNACKYASEADDRRVTLRVREAGNGVEFRVRDRGPGVAPRERRRIFSPFTRARTHAADGSSGLGLGLALARTVARSLGGELRLAVPAEPGAEFVFWLPAEAGEPEGAAAMNPPAERG